MKKLCILLLPLILITLLASCDKASDSSQKTSYAPKTLNVEFVPSQNNKRLEAKIKPLQKLLSEELGVPVNVHISTNYNTIIEGLKSKKVDVAFISPVSYTIAHDQGSADALLVSKGFLVDSKGNKTNKLVDYYRSQIVVNKNSKIKNLEDLTGKKIGLQDVQSTSGYIYPLASMEEKGVAKRDIKVQQIKGYDQALISLLNKDVDAVATYQDARADLKKDYPNIYKDTKVIYRSSKIPNDTISVRSDMRKSWKNKISDAFINISQSRKGNKIISEIYGHEGYEKAQDSDFDVVRQYRNKIEKEE